MIFSIPYFQEKSRYIYYMSEISKNIVSLIVSKEFHKAKTLIHEMMNNKLGILLEEKLLEYAPTLYEQDEEDDHDDVERFFARDPVAKEVNNDMSSRDIIKYGKDLALGASGLAFLAEPVARVITSPLRTPAIIQSTLEKTARIAQKTAPIVGDVAAHSASSTALTASKVVTPVATGAENLLVKTLKYPKLLTKSVGKAFPYLMAANAANDVYQTTMDDTDWKDKPGTAAATLGVDIAKNAVLNAPLFLGIGSLAPIAIGAAVGTGIANRINQGLDYLEQRGPSRDGLRRVDLQFDPATYDPKNIVNGFKSAFSSKKDIEKETQSEVDEFKKEVESSGRDQAVRDADAEGKKQTDQFVKEYLANGGTKKGLEDLKAGRTPN